MCYLDFVLFMMIPFLSVFLPLLPWVVLLYWPRIVGKFGQRNHYSGSRHSICSKAADTSKQHVVRRDRGNVPSTSQLGVDSLYVISQKSKVRLLCRHRFTWPPQTPSDSASYHTALVQCGNDMIFFSTSLDCYPLVCSRISREISAGAIASSNCRW